MHCPPEESFLLCSSYAFFTESLAPLQKCQWVVDSLCVCACVFDVCVLCICLWLCVSSGLNNSHPPIGTHSIIASAFAFRQHFMARLVSVVRDLIAPACLLRHITHANPLPSCAHPHTYMHKSIVCLFTYLISLSIYVLLEEY